MLDFSYPSWSKYLIKGIEFVVQVMIFKFWQSMSLFERKYYLILIIEYCLKMKTTSKSKSKLTSNTPTNKNNNFSQKYLHYTRDRKFLTPKKPSHLRSDSKEPLISRKELLQKFQSNPTPLAGFHKPAKISINMEIKNLNIFGPTNPTNPDSKKKKLHKKTISALGKHQKEGKQKLVNKTEVGLKPKHNKTRSQQNIKLNPVEWGQLLAQHGKPKGESINLVSKYAFCNRRGLAVDKKDKVNQDAYIIIQNFMMADRYLFGVCDGHGVNGHFVSDFIKEILPENIEYFFLKHKAIKKCPKNIVQNALKDAFLKTAKNLQQSGIDVNFSGSTACLLYLREQTLFCANLGDSRAVIFSRLGQQWHCKPLSFDHKAEDQRQACRIKMNGGRVFPYLDEDGQQMGPFRIWIQQKNVPGLAMTRSFGDYVASTVGVISEPEVTTYEITKDDKFMVVASDGLWEFITNEEVMDLIVPAFIRNNAEEAVQVLQRKAVEAWRREDENIDDITIQVIFFKYY